MIKIRNLDACFVFLAAFLSRAVYIFMQPYENPVWSLHWNLSTGLLRFHTLGYSGEKVTNIEPGYPFFLAVARVLSGENYSGVLLCQAAAASAGAIFVYFLAARIKDRRAGILAGLMYAGYPYLIGQSAEIIEVSVFTVLLMASACCFLSVTSSWRAILCGVVFALTLLTRTMVFPAFALGLAALLFQKRIRDFLLISIVTVVVAGPWFLRSHAVDGTWVPPRSGWNFLQANCPYSDKIIPRYNPDLLDAYVSELLRIERPELFNVERLTLAREIDVFYTAKAMAFIKAHPWRTIKLKLKSVFYLFHPRIVPFESMGRDTRIHFTGPETFEIENIPSRGALKEYSHTLSYSFILITALAGIYLRRSRWREDLFLYFIMLNFTVVYSIYWPATRLRAPMDFILMIFSGCFLAGFRKPAFAVPAESR